MWRRRFEMDIEYPDVFSVCSRKARKIHFCCECYHVIPIGEKYQYAKGCWDGRWDEYKTCQSCADLREELKDPYYGVAAFGYLSERAEDRDIEFPVKGD
jgi:hypothetical protein